MTYKRFWFRHMYEPHAPQPLRIRSQRALLKACQCSHSKVNHLRLEVKTKDWFLGPCMVCKCKEFKPAQRKR